MLSRNQESYFHFPMNMPQVKKCDVAQCCYNTNQLCHALAVTIGDGSVAQCDTYMTGCQSKGGYIATTAGVGACKVSICRFNKNLECAAPSIVVGRGAQLADCLTFKAA